MDVHDRTGRLTELRSIIDATPGSDVLKIGAQAIARRSLTDRADDDDPRTTLDPNENEGVTQLVATFEAVFLVAAADGELVRSEVDELSSMLVEITGRAVPVREIEKLIERCAELLDRDDYDARASAIAEQLPEPNARRTAFVMAVGVAYVDGHVKDEERDVFGLLADAFGIDADEATAIVESTRRRLEALDS
jgi:uncharacterized tellurite resistance protein B-like protein